MDASVGTEIGTMTEPDCLGPLDPGTAVSLEGIVWNETDGKYPSPLYWDTLIQKPTISERIRSFTFLIATFFVAVLIATFLFGGRIPILTVLYHCVKPH